jgi:hypothetical protein
MPLQLTLDLFPGSTLGTSIAGTVIARPCSRCGSPQSVIGHGRGPHAAETRCVHCNHHTGWLPRAQFDAIRERMFGQPTFVTGLSTW